MEEKLIGKITHFYGHLSVGIIELSDSVKIGDMIHIKGHSSDFTQQISSMQIKYATVSEAKDKDAIGIKVDQKVHEGDLVYKVV